MPHWVSWRTPIRGPARTWRWVAYAGLLACCWAACLERFARVPGPPHLLHARPGPPRAAPARPQTPARPEQALKREGVVFSLPAAEAARKEVYYPVDQRLTMRVDDDLRVGGRALGGGVRAQR